MRTKLLLLLACLALGACATTPPGHPSRRSEDEYKWKRELETKRTGYNGPGTGWDDNGHYIGPRYDQPLAHGRKRIAP